MRYIPSHISRYRLKKLNTVCTSWRDNILPRDLNFVQRVVYSFFHELKHYSDNVDWYFYYDALQKSQAI